MLHLACINLKNTIMKHFFFILFFITTFSITSQNNITICWDTSLSMENRNIDKEFEFLNSYFIENKNIKATVILFSNSVLEKNNYSIINSDWSKIKVKLLNSIYEGATSYKQLPLMTTMGDMLIFTDGFQNYNEPIVNFKNNLHIIKNI